MNKIILLLLFSSSILAKVDYDQFANDTFRKIDNSVTIQIVPPTYPLDWTTPQNLIFSLVKNKYFFPKTNMVLGHVTAELNCKIAGSRKRKFLGQKVKDLNGFRDHVIKGYGFSVLNRPRNNYRKVPLLTIRGELDNYSDSLKKINDLISKKHFASVSFKIKPDDCINALNFMLEYERKTQNTPFAGNRYGFGAEPSKFEGAGCASFVETVLKLSGVPNVEYWLDQKVYVPEFLLGDISKRRPVSIWKLLFSDVKINEQNNNYKLFIFPDPQVIYDRAKKLSSDPKTNLIFNKKLNSEVVVIGIDLTN